jgi:hypothetical protein
MHVSHKGTKFTKESSCPLCLCEKKITINQRKEQPLRDIAGSILVLAASICFLASALATVPNDNRNAFDCWCASAGPLFFAVAFIPLVAGLYILFPALGQYFLSSKDNPGT